MTMNMNTFVALECMKCSTPYRMDTHSRCEKCGGLLTARYDVTKESFTMPKLPGASMWQFADLLPPVSKENMVSLGEGWTPYVQAPRYAATIGLGGSSSKLYCKLESQNPSGSFKDRMASLGLSLAKEWKKKGVFTASSGNAAAAISAYAARAGIRCLVLIRDDSTESKIAQISMYGPSLLRVRDLFRNQNSLHRGLALTQSALPGWLNHFAWITFNPLLIDAYKTISYEIAATATTASGGKLPEYVFVPTAGGDLLFGIYKGFADLKSAGLIEKIPRMVVVQGEESNPTVRAIENNMEIVEELPEPPRTVAGALRANFGAEHTLYAVRRSDGFGVSLTDEEIISAQRDIARLEGIFCEVSSATALAGVRKSAAEGRIGRNETACAILTGTGFKEFFPSIRDASSVPLAASPEDIPGVLAESYSLS